MILNVSHKFPYLRTKIYNIAFCCEIFLPVTSQRKHKFTDHRLFVQVFPLTCAIIKERFFANQFVGLVYKLEILSRIFI